MAKLHERIFALSGAILFFVTSAALTIVVIVTSIQNRHSSSQPPASPPQNSCQDNQAEPILPAPAAYVPSGPVTALQVSDLTPGNGPSAAAGDCLVVKYYGTLASNGAVFDQNFTKPNGFAFVLGKGQVIPGWDQGLVGLKVGGTRRLVIPASLAYGSQSPSPSIPPNSALVFVVKLLRIQK